MNGVLEVLSPGLMTTVQDAGRAGHGHLGVPLSGACDPWSLAIANTLVGNDAGEAALELTIVGPDLHVLADCVIGVAGADLGGVRTETGERLLPGRSHRLPAGARISFPGPPSRGARAYVALPGGIDVPLVLESRSTCLVARFGGFDGRPLRERDRVSCRLPPDAAPAEATWSSARDEGPIRVLEGPDPFGLGELVAGTWTVATESDRIGLRLDGPGIAPERQRAERRTHGVVPGTVQLPPDGRPIVLLADAQPTGGYPVPAVVATVDVARLGQLPPGGEVRFALVDRAQARRALLDRRAAWEREVVRLAADRDWDELWRSARG
jgi:biotin-dependent carboxylase-like uncharacterized protein